MKYRVGQKVKILRKPTSAEIDVWCDGWVDNMDKHIGQWCTIELIHQDNDDSKGEYSFLEIGYGWPECILQSAETEEQLLFDFMYEEKI